MSDKFHMSRVEEYKGNVKGAAKPTQELRRKRAEVSVLLRKQARDEQLLKRRAMSPEPEENGLEPPETFPSHDQIIEGLRSGEAEKMLCMARFARRILSREQNPPISALLEAGCLPPLVDALDCDDCTDLQFEAAWALTNIASGTTEHTKAVIKAGAVPKLVRLLAGGGALGEQSAWALGNIAGEGASYRDVVLRADALPALLQYLRPDAPATQLRTAVWAYSNLCRNKDPVVKFSLVAPALPYISELLAINDADVLADACWALSYLTDGENERIEAVQRTGGLLARLVRLLAHEQLAVKTPALRAIGNMVTGTDTQTQRCLDSGCLEQFSALLGHKRASLVKEAAWAVSNVLAGTAEQIQAAIDAGLLPQLVHVVKHAEPRCQKEAAWALTNLCLGGAGPQLAAALNAGFLRPYCALLGAADARTVHIVLEGLAHLLQAAERFGELAQLCLRLEEDGVVDRLEALQTHENEAIYRKVYDIVDRYFSEDSENVAPEPAVSAAGDEYQFGSGVGDGSGGIGDF